MNPSLVNGGTATGISALDSECNRTTRKEGKGEVQVHVKFKLKCISHPVAALTSVPVYVSEIHSSVLPSHRVRCGGRGREEREGTASALMTWGWFGQGLFETYVRFMCNKEFSPISTPSGVSIAGDPESLYNTTWTGSQGQAQCTKLNLTGWTSDNLWVLCEKIKIPLIFFWENLNFQAWR